MDRLTIETDRLRLTALTAEALAAWADADADALRAETGAGFTVPLRIPPLFAEDLPVFRDRMREVTDELGWWAWLVSRREDCVAVGVCGLCGRPEDGVVVLGYSVYPEMEGRGFATEASRALMGWIWRQPGVEAVRAYVPSWNGASLAVASKLGMEVVSHEVSREEGDVEVFEARRA